MIKGLLIFAGIAILGVAIYYIFTRYVMFGSVPRSPSKSLYPGAATLSKKTKGLKYNDLSEDEKDYVRYLRQLKEVPLEGPESPYIEKPRDHVPVPISIPSYPQGYLDPSSPYIPVPKPQDHAPVYVPTPSYPQGYLDPSSPYIPVPKPQDHAPVYVPTPSYPYPSDASPYVPAPKPHAPVYVPSPSYPQGYLNPSSPYIPKPRDSPPSSSFTDNIYKPKPPKPANPYVSKAQAHEPLPEPVYEQPISPGSSKWFIQPRVKGDIFVEAHFHSPSVRPFLVPPGRLMTRDEVKNVFKVGDQFRIESPFHTQEIYTVIGISGTDVLLDRPVIHPHTVRNNRIQFV